MITITSSESSVIRIRLNESNVVGTDAYLTLLSPSRPRLIFFSTITKISDGYYSFPLTESQTAELIDDTYTYNFKQNSVILKTGDIRFLSNGTIDTQFDYNLDFALA